MAHMTCKCGNRMSNVVFPNTLEGEIQGLYEYKNKDVWECVKCGRLHIDIDDPNISGYHISKVYVPEDGKIGNLFSVGNGKELIEYLKNMWVFYKEEFKKIESGDL